MKENSVPWQKLEISDTDVKRMLTQQGKRLRFLVDENMGKDAADVLRSLGCNAVFVDELGLVGRSDREVFAVAWRTKRMLLTHDNDFLDDANFPFHRCPGVAVLPGATGNGALEMALADLITCIMPWSDIFTGAKIDVTEDRIWTTRWFDATNGAHCKSRVKLTGKHDAFEWED